MAANHLQPRYLVRTTQTLTSSCSCRTFTSTAPTFARQHKTNAFSLIPAWAPEPPPYPYPRRLWYKQADHGLYGGATIQFGNNVSDKNEIKTRRVWRPNAQFKHLFSVALGRTLRLRVSARVLRTIDKVGGLDNYLLGTSAQRLKELGEEGWKLRWAILHSPSIQERMSSSPTLRKMVQGIGPGSWSVDEAMAEADAEAALEEGQEAELEIMDETDAVVEQNSEDNFMAEVQTRQQR